MKKILAGDEVIVLAGKSKNQRGVVRKIKGHKALVEGVNMVKKHVKPNPNIQEPGGIKTVEAYIHLSNIALVNPATNKADRVGFRVEAPVEGATKGRKVRYFKSNGEAVEAIK